MAGFFGFLLLLALGLLIWSLISPAKFAKRFDKKDKYNLTRKHLGLGFSSIVIALIVLIGVTSPQQPVANKSIQLTTTKSQPANQITTKTETDTKAAPFTSTTVQDSSLAQGTSSVTTQGVNGVETLTYKVTYTNGKQTSKQLISDLVTTKPVTQVTTVGTYVAPASSQTTSPSSTSNSNSCYPTAASGNCYEPGEYCSDADHGMSGVAGDGKSITCEDNDGWRWEP